MRWILSNIGPTSARQRKDGADGVSTRRNEGVIAVVVLAALLSVTTADAQWLNQPTPNIPRTADGKPNLAAPAPRTANDKPDLSGLWTRRSRTNSVYKPLDPPSIDALVRKRNDNFGKESMAALCLPLGPGYLFSNGPDQNFAMTKMIQTPGLIVVLSPDLTYRQIFMDGRALGTRSDDQRSEVALSPETLARYAGIYTERRPHWQDAPVAPVFEIKLADGALFLGATRLTPQSETIFINSGLAIEFVLDGQGVPTHLFDKHVSGDYRFERAK